MASYLHIRKRVLPADRLEGAGLGEGIVRARQFGSAWALAAPLVNPWAGTGSAREHPKEWYVMTSIDMQSSRPSPTNSEYPIAHAEMA